MERSQLRSRVVGAAVGALGALALGGVGLAWAQEAPTTTAPPAAETPAPDSTQPDGGQQGTPPAAPEGCDKEAPAAGDGTGAAAAT